MQINWQSCCQIYVNLSTWRVSYNASQRRAYLSGVKSGRSEKSPRDFVLFLKSRGLSAPGPRHADNSLTQNLDKPKVIGVVSDVVSNASRVATNIAAAHVLDLRINLAHLSVDIYILCFARASRLPVTPAREHYSSFRTRAPRRIYSGMILGSFRPFINIYAHLSRVCARAHTTREVSSRGYGRAPYTRERVGYRYLESSEIYPRLM